MLTFFPHSLRQLWEGAILGSIAHAVAVSRFPVVANEQSWSGEVYNVQDSSGSRGTICFELDEQEFPVRCAGAVFSLTSERRGLVDGIPDDASRYFSEAGSECVSLSQRAFRYLLDDFNGRKLPWVTSGFWVESEECHSQDTWTSFLLNGGYLLERQFKDFGRAKHDWIKEFSMPSSEVNLVRSLYNQKIKMPGEWLTLNHEQVALIVGNKVGVDECRKSFAELRIELP
jgi:hypothetical protein